MAKLKVGIEIPIIPEDFISAEGDLCSDISESITLCSCCCFQPDTDSVEWIIIDSPLVPCPETEDIYQIDHPYLDAECNERSCLIEHFKGQNLYSHVNLEKGERSELAELASNLLPKRPLSAYRGRHHRRARFSGER